MKSAALKLLLLLGACHLSTDPADSALGAVANAYKSGLMATVCHHLAKGPTDPFPGEELQRRAAMVSEAEAKDLGLAFRVWRQEWEALVAVADFRCSSSGRMAADLRDWNDRLAVVLKEYR